MQRIFLFNLFFACSSYNGGAASLAPNDGGVLPDVLGVPANVLYVSADGLAGNDGLSRDKPIKTITGALAYAASVKLLGYEIHVCQGTYRENELTLNYPIALRGGYNCATWARGDGFGFAGKFLDPNRTIVESEARAAGNTTLTIAVADATIVVDGLILRGPSGPGETTSTNRRALAMRDANVVFENNSVEGSTGPAIGTIGSIGAAIRGGAPILRKNRFLGGSGTTTTGTIGSVALRLVGTAAVVEANEIEGGTGSSLLWGGLGIETAVADPAMPPPMSAVVRDNDITSRGGTVPANVPSTVPAMLMFINTPLVVENNRMRLGNVTGPSTGTTLVGVLVNAKSVRILGNRIDPGILLNSPNGRVSSVQVYSGSEVFLANNLLIAPPQPSSISLVGWIDGTTTWKHNTFIMQGGFYTVGLDVQGGTHAVSSNLFLSDLSSSTAARLYLCGGARSEASGSGNVIVSGRLGVLREGADCASLATERELSAVQFDTQLRGSQNRISALGATEVSSFWPALPSTGFLDTTFAPTPQACPELKVAKDADVSVDITGKARSASTAAGAFQLACP
jgi:Protein of unknown function (DUF1565)